MVCVVAVLLLAVAARGHAAPTPCQVATIFGLKTSDCERLGLTSVPVDLDRDVKVMRLSDNRIATVRDDGFAVYPTLQELHLARNRIVVVSPAAFRGLRNLQVHLLFIYSVKLKFHGTASSRGSSRGCHGDPTRKRTSRGIPALSI